MVNQNRLGPNTATSAALLFFFGCCSFPFLRSAVASNGSLWFGFYDSTCPRAEEIVYTAVAERYQLNPTTAAGLIRLFFHDCFIRGCDASVLLDETPSGEPVEKASLANGDTLHGLDFIDAVKSILEAECPGVVSCSDILAFAARDASVLVGIPSYPVPSGRRDGVVSLASDIPGNLPFPFDSVDVLTDVFAGKGLSQREMVILSGAHSIGGAHCSSFNRRLYNFSDGQPQDPTLDPLYAELLKIRCPEPGSLLDELTRSAKVAFDSRSVVTMDASYYTGLVMGKGLLSTDQVLMSEPSTRRVVTFMAKHPRRWAREFGKAMVKLGLVDVLVGDEGEVRTSCRFVNK